MADKYGSWSPYNYAFNDPVFWNDPMGASPNSEGWMFIERSRQQDQPQDASAGMYGDANWNYKTYGSYGGIGGSAFPAYSRDVYLGKSYYNAKQAAAEQARTDAATYGSEVLWGYGQMPHLQTGEEFSGNIYLYLFDAVTGTSSISLFSEAPSICDMAPDSWVPVYGDYQRAKYWAGHGDWSRVAIYSASAVLDVAGITGLARAAIKSGARLFARNSTQLYRAVSQAELDDIARNGLRTKAGGYETSKLFATTLEEASTFGRNNFRFDELPNTLIRVDVPGNVMKSATKSIIFT